MSPFTIRRVVTMKYRNLKGPVSVQIEITEACNLECVHCYNHWRDKSRPACFKNLNQENMNKIIASLIETGVSSVVLTGGEPLLFWNILTDAIQQMISAGIAVGLNSNLSLLTDEIAAFLKESGLRNILVSVLGHKKEIHDAITGRDGSWQKTIDGIKKAKKFGFNVSSNMVLMKTNHLFLHETAKLMKELGIACFCATKASPALNARNFGNLTLNREELRSSLAQLIQIKQEFQMEVDVLECYPLCLISDISKYSFFARRSCTAGVTTCTIGPTGNVRPCSHADMVYGNMFEENLIEIWQKMSDWRNGQYIPDKCHACQFVERCSGGCRMEAKYRGDIRGEDPFMSNPEEVSPCNITSKNNIFNEFEKLKVNPRIKFRDEDFGATAIVPGNAVFLNADAVLILQNLLEQQEFTANFMAEKFDLKIKAVNQFLYHLLQSSIIKKVH
ncbi:MAG: hypothetical protein A2998_02495 [Candidatus Staskawiczbacteria bacterium RIFCSPLOWO2_01_FULL_37_25b]|uniref:Radical SAM core domain-containing protein n=1 Tax=Candidatus Staskawiczbacteria bacterium RIFCSPLOWO2_01_FULL_37_25b TaxID=1802213 RepID=A0A1G2IEG0_9BACT|nr:MAG: hypothetical protein A2998_02495 [Candidatus Staskawiczbacteria bacterium RIFCSPLOWO2_01_FULL_37_25b]